MSGAKRKTLAGVAAYLYRNRTRMRYGQYIANGPVEGACKNLRAIYLSGDFNRYWKFPIQTGSAAPLSRRWTAVPK